MAKNVNAQEYVGKVLVLSDGKSKYVIKSVDGDKLSAEFSRGEGAAANVSLTVAQVESMISAGKAAWSDDEPDPEAVGELVYDTTSATVEEVEEVSAITPTKPVAQTVDMKPKAKNEKPKGEKKGEKKTTDPAPTMCGESTGKYAFSTYTTKKGKTQGRISGFAAEDDAYVNGHDLHGSPYPVDGVLCLSFSKAYTPWAKQMCDALNEGKSVDDLKAMLEQFDADRTQPSQPAAEPAAEDKDAYAVQMLETLMKGEKLPEAIVKRLNPDLVKKFINKMAA